MFTTNYCYGAGGGNSGGNQPTAEALATDILNTMENNTVAVSNMITAWAVEELPATRTAMYKWKCIQGKGWWISSIEKGVHKKVNKGGSTNWEWLSLEHITMTRDGIVLGGDVSFNLLYSNAILGIYNAAMNLGTELTMTTRVVGQPFTRFKTFNSSKSFNVNDHPFLSI